MVARVSRKTLEYRLLGRQSLLEVVSRTTANGTLNGVHSADEDDNRFHVTVVVVHREIDHGD